METEFRLQSPDTHQDHPDPKIRDFKLSIWNWPRIPILLLILAYQKTLSKALPENTCRYHPSCSHYAYRSIYKYGLLRGGLMAGWRILRCNPFSKGGFDPVP